VTYYVIKDHARVAGVGNPVALMFNDPQLDFALLVPTDFANNPSLPAAVIRVCEISKSLQGRTISLIVTKEW
jgi:hypothetical protein